MPFLIKRIHKWIISLVIFILRLYQLLLSPLLPRSCRFWPSCSEYSIQSFYRFGIFKGMSLSILRLLRCHPFHPGGYDPIPAESPVKKKREEVA